MAVAISSVGNFHSLRLVVGYGDSAADWFQSLAPSLVLDSFKNKTQRQTRAALVSNHKPSNLQNGRITTGGRRKLFICIVIHTTLKY